MFNIKKMKICLYHIAYILKSLLWCKVGLNILVLILIIYGLTDTVNADSSPNDNLMHTSSDDEPIKTVPESTNMEKVYYCGKIIMYGIGIIAFIYLVYSLEGYFVKEVSTTIAHPMEVPKTISRKSYEAALQANMEKVAKLKMDANAKASIAYFATMGELGNK